MKSQIIISFLALIIVASSFEYLSKEEAGNEIVKTKEEIAGEKSGVENKINVLRWVLSKDYRRGFIVGFNERLK
jgi:hypothetical protein